jgi:altronate dehydratase large subunit
MGVYHYGQMIDKKGLVFMDGTAYDVASVVSLVAGGAQIVAFTTGMGTPVGNAIAPVVKITGNKDTASRLTDMIDFDTSKSISGEKSVEELGSELFDYIIDVCNGEGVVAEVNGFSDMAINQFYSYS